MRHILQTAARALRNEDGSELVEFALSALVLFTLMFGIMDFCRAAYSYHFTTYAAQEGARFAIVRGYDWSGNGKCNTSAPPSFTLPYRCEANQADVQNYVRSIALPMIDTSNVNVAATWPGTTPDCLASKSSTCSACTHVDQQGCMVNVTVSYTFNFFMPFLPKASGLTFSGTSSKAIQE